MFFCASLISKKLKKLIWRKRFFLATKTSKSYFLLTFAFAFPTWKTVFEINLNQSKLEKNKQKRQFSSSFATVNNRLISNSRFRSFYSRKEDWFQTTFCFKSIKVLKQINCFWSKINQSFEANQCFWCKIKQVFWVNQLSVLGKSEQVFEQSLKKKLHQSLKQWTKAIWKE